MFKHFPKQLQSEGRPYVTNGGVLDGQKWSRHARALHSQDDDGTEGARGRVNAMWASFRVSARKRSLGASCAARVGGRDFPHRWIVALQRIVKKPSLTACKYVAKSALYDMILC